jgi:phage head maturation protease
MSPGTKALRGEEIEMAKRNKKVYAEIAKTEQQDDGTVKVWGYASTGAEDSDGEVITPDCMKAALPDYMAWGNVREMHDSTKAAGVAIEANVGDDGKTWFGAHVIDTEACKKVNAGVYKGFSIGGKVTARDTMNKTIIKGIKLYEVSLVDRPANPEAVFTMVKAQRTDDDELDDVATLLDEGELTAAELAKAAKDFALSKLAKSTAETQSEADKTAATELPADPVATATPPAPAGSPAGSPAPAAKSFTLAVDAVKKSTLGELRKGMYSVSNFASLLQSLFYLCQDAQYEADVEDDGSEIPAVLREWIAVGAEIFGAMAEEEANELIACLGGAAAKATKKGDLAKAASTNTEDPIAKALAPLNEQLSTLQKAVESLTAKNEELGKRAAPGKAFLKAVAVNKGADSVTDAEPVEKAEAVPAEGTVERAQYEMKKSLRNGIALR